MALEVFEQLEKKVEAAISTIRQLNQEIEELKSDKEQNGQSLQFENEQLKKENQRLLEDKNLWDAKIRTLIGKIEETEEKADLTSTQSERNDFQEKVSTFERADSEDSSLNRDTYNKLT